MLGKLGQSAFRGGQVFHRPFAFAPRLLHFYGPLDHVGQFAEVVLEQVVRHSKLDGIHRGGLADRTRQQDERWRMGQIGHRMPGIEGRETGQAVIGKDHVEGLLAQGLRERRQRFDALQLADEAGAPQGLTHDVMVQRRVF